MSNKLILFDYDGTIADTQDTIISGIKFSLQKFNIDIPKTNILRSYIGRALIPVYQEITKSNDEELINKLLKAYRDWYYENQSSNNLKDSIFPNVFETIELLYERGYLMGIATNKSRAGLIDGLRRHNLMKYFSVIKTVNECSPKPDPEMGDMALEEMSVLKEDALMIGDTINDALMAKNCGIRFIGVQWGYNDSKILAENDAFCIVEDFADLPKQIESCFNSYG